MNHKEEIVPSRSAALPPVGATSLAHRNREDLLAISRLQEWCERGIDLWDQGNHKEAVRCFARGLQLDPDHATLQFYLGLAYYTGLGLPERDYIQAVTWWRKAAEQGSAYAQNNLARSYEQGHGVQRDYTRAIFWYRRAAEQRHPTAQFNLAVMYEGGLGVAQDFTFAAAWYSEAAEQGYAAAQYNLGCMFRSGCGMTQNYTRAAFWYRRAAEQNYSMAQFNLGVMYERGEGVAPNLLQAAEWYRRAGELGEESARQALHNLLSKK